MINLLFDELRLIAQIGNISDYDLRRFDKSTQRTKTRNTKTRNKTKNKNKTDKEKLRKLRKDFDELRHNFSKKEIDRYKKAFYCC